VRIRAKVFSDYQWRRAEKAIAARALTLAKLLAGEMPHDIEDVLAACKLTLLPGSYEELLEQLRARRARATGKRPASDGVTTDAAAIEGPAPLSDLLDRFWRAGPELTELHVSPLAAEAPDALLGQLGPLAVDVGDQNLVELLRRAYVQLASAAERRALAE
jgi:uncharacterized Zn finger protein